MTEPADRVLRAAVRDLAGEVRTVPGLAAGAMARGRRIRRRRRLGVGLAAVVAVGAVGAPYAVLHSMATPMVVATPSPTASPTPTPPPRVTLPTTLPPADGVPGAAERPDLVGTDAGILHFDVALSIVDDLHLSMWDTADGLEAVGISYGNEYHLGVSLALTRERLSRTSGLAEPLDDVLIRGRPATMLRYFPPDATPPVPPTWSLTWQPVDGLWAAVEARDVDSRTAIAVAENLYLDRAQRCVMPIRATVVPPDARWGTCMVGVKTSRDALGAWWYSKFSLTMADGEQFGVSLEPRPPDRSLGGPKDQFRPNRTVGEYPAMWTVENGELRINDYRDLFDLYVYGEKEADVLALAAGLRFDGDLTDPSTWTRPLP
jgi:hypothetical protein